MEVDIGGSWTFDKSKSSLKPRSSCSNKVEAIPKARGIGQNSRWSLH